MQHPSNSFFIFRGFNNILFKSLETRSSLQCGTSMLCPYAARNHTARYTYTKRYPVLEFPAAAIEIETVQQL